MFVTTSTLTEDEALSRVHRAASQFGLRRLPIDYYHASMLVSVALILAKAQTVTDAVKDRARDLRGQGM